MRAFGPSRKNLVAGLVLGLVLIVVGLTVGYWMYGAVDNLPRKISDRIALYGMTAVCGLLVPLGGVALILWSMRSFSRCLWLCENGLAYVYRGYAELCPWDAIQEIREELTEEPLHILHLPGAAIHRIARSLVVQRDDGEEFPSTANTVKHLDAIITRLRVLSHTHGIPWSKTGP